MIGPFGMILIVNCLFLPCFANNQYHGLKVKSIFIRPRKNIPTNKTIFLVMFLFCRLLFIRVYYTYALVLSTISGCTVLSAKAGFPAHIIFYCRNDDTHILTCIGRRKDTLIYNTDIIHYNYLYTSTYLFIIILSHYSLYILARSVNRSQTRISCLLNFLVLYVLSHKKQYSIAADQYSLKLACVVLLITATSIALHLYKRLFTKRLQCFL